MSSHLTPNQVEDYCRQNLSAGALLQVSDHLGKCEVCRRKVEGALDGDRAFLGLLQEVFAESAENAFEPFARTHLTVERAARYVDNGLAGDELQLVTDHLASCEHCAAAVDDLRAFREHVSPALDRKYKPGPDPAIVGAVSVNALGEGWWHRFVAPVWSPFQRRGALAFGAVLTVVLFSMTGWWIWLSLKEEPIKDQVVVTPAPPPEDGPILVNPQLNDGGGLMTLDNEGNLSGADQLPPPYQRMVKEALTSQRVEPSPLLKGLARRSSRLMSTDKDADKFSVTEPIGKVVLTARPTFRWSRLDGATDYVVEIYDSKFNLVVHSPQLSNDSWTVSQSLARGDVYGWQVKAIKDGREVTSPRPPAPPARFRVLDRAKANELEQARRAYASSHLALGLLYARAGLLEEAKQQLQTLERANPNSEVARKLLATVQAMRH